MADKERKFKLSFIRRVTPNPIESLTGFDPDNEGKEINKVADIVIVNKVLKDGREALRHIEADPKSSFARQKLLDAKDENDWAQNKGDWDPNKQVEPPKQLEPPKKRRRR